MRDSYALSYSDLQQLPQVTVTKALECAGNGRRFFQEAFGTEAEGVQWRLGAIGVAEWTGVRLADLLNRAGVVDQARDVMLEGLDDHHGRRPMPLAKALAEDTILALRMNGEPLPADHGFPARVLVPGWIGTASIKWVGRIEVAVEELHVPWNTEEYILAGDAYPAQRPGGRRADHRDAGDQHAVPGLAGHPAARQPRRARPRLRRRRSGARALFGVDHGPWENARLAGPSLPGAGVRFQLPFSAEPGYHEIRTRAVDHHGRAQLDAVPWNDKGCCYNAGVAHPINVT